MYTQTSTHNLAAHSSVAVLRPILTSVIPDVISPSCFCLRKCDRAMKLWLLRQRAGQIWLVTTGKDTHIHKHTHTCVFPDSTRAYIKKRTWWTHVDRCLMWPCFCLCSQKARQAADQWWRVQREEGGGRETGDEWGRNRRKRSVLVNVTWSHLSDWISSLWVCVCLWMSV